jgi:hypothetical protein
MNINKLISSETFQSIVKSQVAAKEQELSELKMLLRAGHAGAHGEDGPEVNGMAAVVNAVPEVPVATVIAFVASNPGSPADTIRKQFQMTQDQWNNTRTKPEFKSAVESKGQKRGTRYFIRQNQ